MAIFLIMGVNHSHIDPVKDLRGCYQIGDVITVNEDEAHDGDLVRNPIAPGRYVIKISGMSRVQGEKYVASHIDNTNPDDPVRLRRRLFKIDINNLPSAVRNKLNQDRYVEVSFSQLKNYIQNKVTGITE